jgi:hypothetical protein
VGLAALFVAMGGTAYAGVTANSVGTQHLRDDAVTAPKIAQGAVRTGKVKDGTILRRDIAPGVIPAPVAPRVYQITNAFGADTGGATMGGTAPNPDGTCILGEMILVATNKLPSSFFPANGQTLAISEYEAMFSLIGTYYGGNGSSTFRLPDMRRSTPNHMTWGICMYGIYPSSG